MSLGSTGQRHVAIQTGLHLETQPHNLPTLSPDSQWASHRCRDMHFQRGETLSCTFTCMLEDSRESILRQICKILSRQNTLHQAQSNLRHARLHPTDKDASSILRRVSSGTLHTEFRIVRRRDHHTVSLKKVLNTPPPPPMVWSLGFCPSCWTACSRHKSSPPDFSDWMFAWPVW